MDRLFDCVLKLGYHHYIHLKYQREGCLNLIFILIIKRFIVLYVGNYKPKNNSRLRPFNTPGKLVVLIVLFTVIFELKEKHHP